jgi:hypothetical protein
VIILKKFIVFPLLFCLLFSGCSQNTDPAAKLSDTYQDKVESIRNNFPEIPADIWTGALAGLTEADLHSDWYTLAQTHGHVVVCISANYLSHERTAILLLQIKDTFDKADVPFQQIDFLHSLRNGKSYIHIQGFPYSEIYSENLVTRLEEQFEIQRSETDATEGG